MAGGPQTRTSVSAAGGKACRSILRLSIQPDSAMYVAVEAQPGGGHRRQLLRALQFLVARIGSTAQCSWDKLDDLAADVNMICCGADNERCGGGSGMPDACSPGCAVSLHQVTDHLLALAHLDG